MLNKGGSVEIYHGSDMIVKKPKVIIGKYHKDFSWGFYCTKSTDQAKRWAIKQF